MSVTAWPIWRERLKCKFRYCAAYCTHMSRSLCFIFESRHERGTRNARMLAWHLQSRRTLAEIHASSKLICRKSTGDTRGKASIRDLQCYPVKSASRNEVSNIQWIKIFAHLCGIMISRIHNFSYLRKENNRLFLKEKIKLRKREKVCV